MGDEQQEEEVYSVDGREECHPLLNPVVLKNIFKYLRVRDLKPTRLVCSAWYDFASPHLQNEAQVKLDGHNHSTSRTVYEFLNQFISDVPENIFFRHYKLNAWCLDGNCPQLRAFWKKFGPTMKSVELSSARFLGLDVVRDILFHWTPQLQRLYLTDCSFYGIPGQEKPGYLVLSKATETKYDVRINNNLTSLGFFGGEPHVCPPITWEEIFIAYPNLKQLQLYNLSPTETAEILDTVIQRIKNAPGSLDIEKLHIFNGDSVLESISDQNLILVTKLHNLLVNLKMDIGVFINEGLITKFLTKNAPTLRKLNLYRGPLANMLPNFPFGIHFPNLRILKMTDTLTESINFIDYMPNLYELSILNMANDECALFPTDMIRKTNSLRNVPHKNLYNLTIDFPISNEDLKKLITWFPCVKKVRLEMNNEGLRMVCAAWKNLVDVEILNAYVTDDGITGIDNVCANSSISERSHPFLGSLKELRRFIMNNMWWTTNLTDLSITHGFQYMTSPCHLELCSAHVTVAGWQILRDKYNYTTVLPSDRAYDRRYQYSAKRR